MPTDTTPAVDVDAIRRQFPALDLDVALLENAGGSQVPRVVADAIRDYMLETYVQLEASYDLSERATRVVDDAHAFANRMMNGEGRGHAIFGASTSQLLAMLARCYEDVLSPDDEIIVAEAGHEANVAPWVKLTDRGRARLVWWPIGPGAPETCPLDALRERMTPRTRLVALPHVSNLLGEIVDLAAVTEIAHAGGARVVADGVAYAPHRAVDVAAWDVDWYAYSMYKVYGPHMAVLYGRRDAVDELEGPNHFFIDRRSVPYKFELGCLAHESCAGLLALRAYLAFLAGGGDGGERATIERAFEVMQAAELPVQTRLVEGLLSRDDVRIIGPAHARPSRVGTVSFVHERLPSQVVSDAINRRGVAIRHGNMYAHRLCTAAGLEPDDGVVRVSLVHYNTVDEIERCLAALDEAEG